MTLIIHVISHSGGSVPFGFGFLMNADNGAKYGAFIFIVHGEARWASLRPPPRGSLMQDLHEDRQLCITVMHTQFSSTTG